MKLLSWNVYNFNSHLDQALEFVLSQDADIICLQEVPGELLHKLQALPDVEIAYEIDCFEKGIVAYLVTVSRNRIIDKGGVNFLDKHKTLLQKLLRWDEGMHALWVDLEVDGRAVRIFNTHLSMGTGPGQRTRQMEQVTSQFAINAENILCGDFNSFYSPPWGLLAGWLLGVGRGDFSTWELNNFHRLCNQFGLQDVASGRITFPVLGSGFELDHILVPKSSRVVTADLLKNKPGSDHFPLVAEIGLLTN